MDTDSLAPHEDDARLADDVLIGRDPIKRYAVISLGMPETTDPYYLKQCGWPIGNTGGASGKLIALKSRLRNHLKKIAAGKSAA